MSFASPAERARRACRAALRAAPRPPALLLARGALAVVLAAGVLAACSAASVPGAAPRCDGAQRLALVAQAVPGAAYVPCVGELAEGWRDGGFVARPGHVRFTLQPGRAAGRTVTVTLDESCDRAAGSPLTPRAAGVRTSMRLRSISPRYAGTITDAFAGGCVTYDFDFERGPHIPLMEELQSTVGLVARQDLRLEVRRQLGTDL